MVLKPGFFTQGLGRGRPRPPETTKSQILAVAALSLFLASCSLYKSQGRNNFESKITGSNPNLNLNAVEITKMSQYVELKGCQTKQHPLFNLQSPESFKSFVQAQYMTLEFQSENYRLWLDSQPSLWSIVFETLSNSETESCYFVLSEPSEWPILRKTILERVNEN